MSLNCNLDLMCSSGSGLGDFIFLLPFWGNNLNAYYKDFVPASTTFKRASAANQVDDLGLTPVAIDVPKLNKGITLEGTTTNKITAAKNNPSATTNITKGGDAASVLSVVADTAKLADVGLQEYGPNVYKLDNSLGTTAATATFGGQTGNTNKHTISVIIRSTATTTLSLGTTTKDFAASSYYYRRILENITPSATTNSFIISIPAGAVCYFTLPQLEENPVVSTPISGSTGTITRASEGTDTSGNGLSVALSQAMIDGLVGELLDGTSAWTHVSGTAPSYSGGNRILTYSGSLTSSDYHALSATISTSKQIEVNYTISGYSTGSIALGFGSGAAGASRNAGGTYTERGTLTGNTNLYVNASGFTGVLNILSIRRVLDSGQTNPGEGTVLCGVYLPWDSSVIPDPKSIPLLAASDTSDIFLYLRKSSGLYRLRLSDGISISSITPPANPGPYIPIAQYSARTSQMRVGLYNQATSALTWGSYFTYRGFFPIYGTGDQQRLRYYYGGSQFPIHISSTAWYNQILSDNEILGIIPSLTKYDPITYIVDGNGNLIVDENGENLIL